jgi:hypothetical protein
MEKASGCLHPIAHLLIYLLAGLLILSLPLSILANHTLKTLFSPDEVGSAIANLLILQGGLRDRLAEGIVSETWSGSGTTEGSRALANLSSADRAEVSQILFPADWVKIQVQENIEILIDWIESEEPFPQLFLDLDAIRHNIMEGGSLRIAEIWVDSLAPCNREQEAQLDLALQQGSSAALNFCKPEGELRKRLVNFVNEKWIQQIDQVPAEVPILDRMGSEELTKGLNEFRRNILSFLLLLRWMRLLPFLFLGLIMTLKIRSWQALGRWWGIPIGLGSIFTLAMILIGHALGPGIIQDTLSQSAQPVEFQESIVNSLWGLISAILNRSAFHALIFLGIAAVAFILPNVLGKREKESTHQPSPTVSSGERLDIVSPPPPVEPFQPDTITNVPTNDLPDGTDISKPGHR